MWGGGEKREPVSNGCHQLTEAGLIGGHLLTRVVDTGNDSTDRSETNSATAGIRSSRPAIRSVIYLSCTLGFIGTVNSVKAHPSVYAHDKSIFSNRRTVRHIYRPIITFFLPYQFFSSAATNNDINIIIGYFKVCVIITHFFPLSCSIIFFKRNLQSNY